jgi:hypothetical protein
VYLPGIDKQNRSFNIDLIIDPKKYPTAFGADQLNGFLSIRVFLRRPVVNIRTNGVKLISRMALICPFGDNLIA